MVLECLNKNKNIVGVVTDISTHKDVPDLEQCKRKFCQPNLQCNAFVYSPETKICDLKNVEMAGLMMGTVSFVDATGKTLGLDKIEGVCVGKKYHHLYLYRSLQICKLKFSI